MWHPTVAPEALVESMDSANGCFCDFSLSTRSVKGVHLLGAPERGPGGCDNSPVGIVRPWGEYFEALASLFVCLKDKTCPRAEGGQGDGGACCSAAGAPVVLSRLVSRGSAPLCFVRSRLSAVTEDILYSWSAASSRVIQASTF